MYHREFMASSKNKKNMPKKVKAGQVAAAPEKSRFSVAGIAEFIAEVKKEFLKITWPPKNTTMRTTAVVIVLVFLISFYLGAVDLILGKLINFILK